MEAQTEFKRKARIGINPITIEQGQTRFLHIKSKRPELFEKKDGDTVNFVMAVDMQTGEEGHFWLAGSLRANLEKMADERGSIQDVKIEVKALGKQPVEMKDENNKLVTRDVNQFDLYELN